MAAACRPAAQKALVKGAERNKALRRVAKRRYTLGEWEPPPLSRSRRQSRGARRCTLGIRLRMEESCEPQLRLQAC